MQFLPKQTKLVSSFHALPAPSFLCLVLWFPVQPPQIFRAIHISFVKIKLSGVLEFYFD